MANNPVVWFEIYVNDMKRAQRFYETVLGIDLQPLPTPDPNLEMMSFPMNASGDGASGALARMEGGPSPGGGTMVYFRCDDCAVEASRVSGAGGTLIKDKHSIGQYGHIAIAQDTEGNMLGLHSMT